MSSCDTKEDFKKETESAKNHRTSDEDLEKVSNILKKQDSKKLARKKYTEIDVDPTQPYIDLVEILEEANVTIEIDERTVHILDNSFDANMQYMRDLNIYSPLEINVITAFKDELVNTNNFTASIARFESAILSLPLTVKKLQKFYNLIDGLKAMNTYDPNYFAGNMTAKSNGGLFGSCLSATIGTGIAFVGLATIEVGSFGVGTAAAVAGFIWAGAEWGKACGGKGKKVYPKAIVKEIEMKDPVFITFDEDGDLKRSPILIIPVRRN